MATETPKGNACGPMGTPNAGREERIAKQERRDAIRYRAAALRLERQDGTGDSELRILRQEVRSLHDWFADLRREVARLRAELPSLLEAELARVLADQLPEALDYLLAHREVSRNGTATQAPRR